MSTLSFRCPRLTDREVVERLTKIAKEMGLSNTVISFIPFQGGNWQSGTPETLDSNEIYKELLNAHGACAPRIDLIQTWPPPQGGEWRALQLHRVPDDLFDKLEVEWRGPGSGT